MFLFFLLRTPQWAKWLVVNGFFWLRAVATLQVVTLAPLLLVLLLLPWMLFPGRPANRPGLTQPVRPLSAGFNQVLSNPNGSREASR